MPPLRTCNLQRTCTGLHPFRKAPWRKGRRAAKPGMTAARPIGARGRSFIQTPARQARRPAATGRVRELGGPRKLPLVVHLIDRRRRAASRHPVTHSDGGFRRPLPLDSRTRVTESSPKLPARHWRAAVQRVRSVGLGLRVHGTGHLRSLTDPGDHIVNDGLEGTPDFQWAASSVPSP